MDVAVADECGISGVWFARVLLVLQESTGRWGTWKILRHVYFAVVMGKVRLLCGEIGNRGGEELGPSMAVGVAWPASWWATYTLKNTMDRITALEQHVSMTTPSLASVRIVLLEMAAGDSVMAVFVVAYLLLPIVWGWRVARIELEGVPVGGKAAAFLISLAIPWGSGQGLCAFFFPLKQERGKEYEQEQVLFSICCSFAAVGGKCFERVQGLGEQDECRARQPTCQCHGCGE